VSPGIPALSLGSRTSINIPKTLLFPQQNSGLRDSSPVALTSHCVNSVFGKWDIQILIDSSARTASVDFFIILTL
jgi:hypothetical protein